MDELMLKKGMKEWVIKCTEEMQVKPVLPQISEFVKCHRPEILVAHPSPRPLQNALY